MSPPAVWPAGIINILLSTVQAHVPQKTLVARGWQSATPSAQTIIAKIVVSWYTRVREHCHNGKAAGHFPSKGGDAMVTYEGLFSFCLVIIGIIALFQGNKK